MDAVPSEILGSFTLRQLVKWIVRVRQRFGPAHYLIVFFRRGTDYTSVITTGNIKLTYTRNIFVYLLV